MEEFGEKIGLNSRVRNDWTPVDPQLATKCFIPEHSIWKINETVGKGERETQWDVSQQLELPLMGDFEVLQRIKEVDEFLQGQIEHYVYIDTYKTNSMKGEHRFKLMLNLDRDYRLI